MHRDIDILSIFNYFVGEEITIPCIQVIRKTNTHLLCGVSGNPGSTSLGLTADLVVRASKYTSLFTPDEINWINIKLTNIEEAFELPEEIKFF